MISMKRFVVAAGMCVAMLGATMLDAGHAAGQGGDNGIVGTWASTIPDGRGGMNHQWFTFGADGSYRMVSAVQGGGNNGSVVQRWGNYQARPEGQGQYQAAVHVTGGAPTQICSQGQGCTPVQGIQQNYNWQFSMRNGQLVQGNAVFQRGQVPPQLQQQMAGNRQIQGPVAPANPGHVTPVAPGHVSPTMPHGVGGRCDDAQQANICHYGNGGFYHKDHDTGCMICDQY